MQKEIKRKHITKQERQDIYNKYSGRCAYCGNSIEYKDMQVDHLVPLRNGGEDSFENYMPSCRRCNHYKRANRLETFREMIQEIPLKLRRDNYIYKVGLDYGLIRENLHTFRFHFEWIDEQREESQKIQEQITKTRKYTNEFQEFIAQDFEGVHLNLLKDSSSHEDKSHL